MTDPAAGAVDEAADRLEEAQRTGVPCAPVRDLLPPGDIDAAYAVQRELVRRRTAAGAIVVGRKIGLTAPVVQQQLGVDQPDFGVLFADMQAGASVPAGRLLQARTEAEVAFVLGRDLATDDPAEVRAAVDFAVGALEIVDSRIAAWDITITDTVADNGSSGLFVLGREHLSLDDVEPRDVQMRMWVDEEQASDGSGVACLGDPLTALGWLARTAAEYGEPLRAGQVVLSGALGPMVATGPGSVVRADLGPLGEITVVFER